jgi:solute:Na+ symporter, SSS family
VILHEQLPPEQFDVVGSTSTSEFPLHRIMAVVIINLIGIVVQPHFIATGGGSAKTEFERRVGLVVGNFLKRFCTIGWVLTALIAWLCTPTAGADQRPGQDLGRGLARAAGTRPDAG